MIPQHKKLLTILGCSGSAALMLSFGHPTEVTAVDFQNSELNFTAVVQSETNPIMDALGCSCASCQMSQMKSY